MRLGESREALVFRSIETANKTKKCIEGRKSLWHDLADERFFFQIGTCSCGSGDDAARHYFQQHTYQSRRRCLGSRYSFPSVFPKYYRFFSRHILRARTFVHARPRLADENRNVIYVAYISGSMRMTNEISIIRKQRKQTGFRSLSRLHETSCLLSLLIFGFGYSSFVDFDTSLCRVTTSRFPVFILFLFFT